MNWRHFHQLLNKIKKGNKQKIRWKMKAIFCWTIDAILVICLWSCGWRMASGIHSPWKCVVDNWVLHVNTCPLVMDPVHQSSSFLHELIGSDSPDFSTSLLPCHQRSWCELHCHSSAYLAWNYFDWLKIL